MKPYSGIWRVAPTPVALSHVVRWAPLATTISHLAADVVATTIIDQTRPVVTHFLCGDCDAT